MKRILFIIFMFLIIIPEIIFGKEITGYTLTNDSNVVEFVTYIKDGGYIISNDNGEIVRYDYNNNIIWKKSKNDLLDNTTIGDLETTKDGNVVMCGAIHGEKIFILKFDIDGNVLWSSVGQGHGFANLVDVEENVNGDFIAVGYDGLSPAEPNGQPDEDFEGAEVAILYAVDKNGENPVYKMHDTPSMERYYSIDILDDGSYLVGGYVGYDEFLGYEVNDSGSVVVKFNSNHEHQLLRNYDANIAGENSTTIYDIETVENGYIVVNGINFGMANYEENNSVISRFDLDGKLIYEYPVKEELFDVVVTATGKVIAVGYYENADYEKIGVIYVLNSDGTLVERKEVGEKLLDINLLTDNTIVGVGSKEGGLIFRIKTVFDVTVYDSENGSAEAIKTNGKAIIKTMPNDKFELDTIKIVDTTGKEVIPKKNDDGTFEYIMMDDTFVNVTFIDNPKTGNMNIIVFIPSIIFMFMCLFFVIKMQRSYEL